MRYFFICCLVLLSALRFQGGGGGAGALLSYTGQVEPSGNYTISVGAGGASSTNGGNSSAFSWTAVGGGAGGSSCISVPLSEVRICCLGVYGANGTAGGLPLLSCLVHSISSDL